MEQLLNCWTREKKCKCQRKRKGKASNRWCREYFTKICSLRLMIFKGPQHVHTTSVLCSVRCNLSQLSPLLYILLCFRVKMTSLYVEASWIQLQIYVSDNKAQALPSKAAMWHLFMSIANT